MLYIVVPYRNRMEDMKQFLSEAVPAFRRAMPDCSVVFIEQGNTKPFNRGLLLNAAVKFLSKDDGDEFIFHDVDIIPTSDSVETLYKPPTRGPIIGICSHTYSIGGVTKLSRHAIEKLNGFPTNYWGWGYEDVMLKLRAELLGIHYDVKGDIDRGDISDKFKMLNEEEGSNYREKYGHYHPNNLLTQYFRTRTVERRAEIVRRSGLSTTHYKVLRHLRDKGDPLVQFVTVDI